MLIMLLIKNITKWRIICYLLCTHSLSAESAIDAGAQTKQTVNAGPKFVREETSLNGEWTNMHTALAVFFGLTLVAGLAICAFLCNCCYFVWKNHNKRRTPSLVASDLHRLRIQNNLMDSYRPQISVVSETSSTPLHYNPASHGRYSCNEFQMKTFRPEDRTPRHFAPEATSFRRSTSPAMPHTYCKPLVPPIPVNQVLPPAPVREAWAAWHGIRMGTAPTKPPRFPPGRRAHSEVNFAVDKPKKGARDKKLQFTHRKWVTYDSDGINGSTESCFSKCSLQEPLYTDVLDSSSNLEESSKGAGAAGVHHFKLAKIVPRTSI